MINMCFIIFTIGLMMLIAFCITFTVVWLYIIYKRRTIKKYRFEGEVEELTLKHSIPLETSIPTGIDGDTSLKHSNETD